MRVAAGTGSTQSFQIICHQLILPLAIIIKKGPAENAGIMPIIKGKPDRIIANRFDAGNFDKAFARRRYLLSGAMALHLG